MNENFYNHLVDLYAGDELQDELVTVLDEKFATDPGLAADASSLRTTIQTLRRSQTDGMTEVCYQRVLKRILEEANLPDKRADDRHQYRFKFGG